MPARRTYQQGGWIDFKTCAADPGPSLLGVKGESGMLTADSLILIGRCDLAYIAGATIAGWGCWAKARVGSNKSIK